MTAKLKLTGQPLAKTTPTPPTTAQILAQQKADAERERAEPEAMPPEQQLAASTGLPAPVTNDEALERHLSDWGGSGGPLIAFNGSTGIHRTLDDGVEVPPGTEYAAFLHETQRGHIKFNAGAPPDVRMISISADAEVPRREELGDFDQSQWPLGLDGQRQDPWKEQIAFPLARLDAGGELFVYVARGQVALNAVADLLGRYRRHPKRQAGLIPVIRLESGTYPSKKFGGFKPKPLFVIVSWVTKDGNPPPPPPPLSTEMNDSLDF